MGDQNHVHELPKFELFPDPVGLGSIVCSDETCDICGQSRGFMHDANQYAEIDEWSEALICPWCISDGSAAAKGIRFNEAERDGLADVDLMTAEDKELVESRTPTRQGCQHELWLACCGRACIYLGEADAEDLRGRWAGALSSLLAEGGWPADDPEEFINGATGERRAYWIYIFQCRVCQQLKGTWDSM